MACHDTVTCPSSATTAGGGDVKASGVAVGVVAVLEPADVLLVSVGAGVVAGVVVGVVVVVSVLVVPVAGGVVVVDVGGVAVVWSTVVVVGVEVVAPAAIVVSTTSDDWAAFIVIGDCVSQAVPPPVESA